MPSHHRRRAAKPAAAAWTPQDVASLVFDINLDLLDATHSDGDQVVDLPDAEGAVTFTRFGANQGGEFRPDQANANGHDGVELVQARDDFYQSNPQDISALFPTAATIVAVAELNDTQFALYEDGDHDGWWCHNFAAYHATFKNTRVEVTPAVGEPSSGVHYWVIRSSASGYNVRRAGVQRVAAAADFVSGTRHRIGWQSRGLNGFNGIIYRVMGFNAHLSDAVVTTQLEPYIQTTYALS